MRRALFWAIATFMACLSPVTAQPLSFGGFACSSDCSGHIAGFNWAVDRQIKNVAQCAGNSQSFREGCTAYVLNPNATLEGHWLHGFGQGTSEAGVHNIEGGKFYIFCSGGGDGKAGLSFSRSNNSALGNGIVAFISVGSVKKYVQLNNGVIRASTRSEFITIRDLYNAIFVTNDRFFYVSLPTTGNREIFSVLGAREALKTIDMQRCAM